MLHALLKAPLAGMVVTLLAAALIHALENQKTFLLIHKIDFNIGFFYWSWPIFLVATLGSFAFFWMTE